MQWREQWDGENMCDHIPSPLTLFCDMVWISVTP